MAALIPSTQARNATAPATAPTSATTLPTPTLPALNAAPVLVPVWDGCVPPDVVADVAPAAGGGVAVTVE